MACQKLPTLGAVGCAVILFLAGPVLAESEGNPQQMQSRLDALSQQLNEQKELLSHLETFRQQYAEQRALLQLLERQVAQQRFMIDKLQGVASWDTLAAQRGTGNSGVPVQVAQVSSDAVAPVGQAPSTEGRPPEVAPLFEQPGVLTPKGRYVLEPSLQYGYSSSNRVALVGYTIIPALLVGLIDVREVKRSTVTGALAARFGVTNRLELEVRVPYAYRSDSNVARPYAVGGSLDEVFNASGMGVGDIEFGARYQLNNGGIDSPFYIGTFRFKTRTGKDSFEVITNCKVSCGASADVTAGLPTDLPLGSGFYSAQLGLTVLYPSDPAVFFGSVTYMHNIARNNVSRNILDGQQEYLGTIAPGDVMGLNFGMGLALNEKSSFSLGFDLNTVGRTQVGGQAVAGSVRTQLASMLLGYSYRLNPKTSLSVSVGAGLTRDTPDVSVTVRVPVTF